MDDSTLLLTGERLVKDDKALEAGYRTFRILTNRHSGYNITDPATRQLIAKAYNWRAIITLTYSHDYPTAMRLFIKALDYSDNNVSPTLANNIAHLFNVYAQCLPTADNIRRALDMYHAAFHAAIKTKDWEENASYGRTFPAILTEARVKLACRRISESDVYDKFTIEGIATDIGFNSRGGFVRAFKLIFTMHHRMGAPAFMR